MTDAKLADQLRQEWAEWDNRVAQILGKALGRPWFKDDQTNFPGATESDGVILVEEDAESLAVVAAGRLEALAAERDAAVARAAELTELLREVLAAGPAGSAEAATHQWHTIRAMSEPCQCLTCAAVRKRMELWEKVESRLAVFRTVDRATELLAGKGGERPCPRCHGRPVARCRRCGEVRVVIHKYSDCDSPGCDGERSDDVPCPECGGKGGAP